MKRWLILFFLFSSVGVFAQREIDPAKPSFKDRMYVGGGLGLGGGTDYYGNNYFYVQVSPILGYMITNNFSAGVIVPYQYVRYKNIGTSNQYGVSPFLRYSINPIFFQAEYDVLSVNSPYVETRQIYNRALGGIGIAQPLGQGRGAVNALAMYDFAYQNNGIFASPWVIRIFFTY